MGLEGDDDNYPFYRGTPPHQKTPTSREAAERIRAFAASIRERVRKHIATCDGRGATCDEVEARLDLRHQTASARVRELAKEGSIYDSGVTRATRSGRKAVVWLARTNALDDAVPTQGSLI